MAALSTLLRSMKSVLLDPTKHWECASCGRQHVTKEHMPHMPLHECPKMAGAIVPFTEAGVKAGLRVNYREDYLGTSIPTTDGNGKPVMSVTTMRNDGEDTHVFPACAVIKYES